MLLFYIITGSIALFSSLNQASDLVAKTQNLTQNQGQVQAQEAASLQPEIISSQEFSLTNRYHNQFVNEVFADNILLTLSYMTGEVKSKQDINWDQIRQPKQTSFMLKPGETFAFHDHVAAEYQDQLAVTTNAHFNATDGFRSSGKLFGDGVCHLASFINVVATQAGMQVDAPVRHDFAKIPDISREFGTSIYYNPNDKSVGSRQNLYITNTTNQTIAFVFDHSFESVKITVEKI